MSWQNTLINISNKTNSKAIKYLCLNWWESSAARGKRHALEFVARNPSPDKFRRIYAKCTMDYDLNNSEYNVAYLAALNDNIALGMFASQTDYFDYCTHNKIGSSCYDAAHPASFFAFPEHSTEYLEN